MVGKREERGTEKENLAGGERHKNQKGADYVEVFGKRTEEARRREEGK